MVEHACKPSSWGTEAGRLGVQRWPRLHHSEFQASLGGVRLSQDKPK